MAITSNGYDGTVDEVQWAKLASSLGARDGVAGETDWKVTVVAGLDRTVAIAAGAGYGHGIIDVNSASFNLQLPTLGSGTRWDTVVARRDWQPPTGITTFEYATGTTTQAVASGVNDNPGVVSDQLLALVQITAGVQAPTAVVDLRTWPSKVVYATTQPPAARYAYGTLLLVAGVLYRRTAVSGSAAWVADNAPAWTNLTLASGIIVRDGLTPRYRVVADRLELRGHLGRNPGVYWTDGQTVTLCSVPSTVAPVAAARVPCTWTGGLMISTSGVMTADIADSGISWVSLDGISIPIGA